MPSSWKSSGFAILGSNKSSLWYCIWTFRWLRGQNTTVITNLADCAVFISRWQRVCTHDLDHLIHAWQTKQTTANKAAVYQINGFHCVHANTRLWWFIFTITIGCLPYHMAWMQEKNPSPWRKLYCTRWPDVAMTSQNTRRSSSPWIILITEVSNIHFCWVSIIIPWLFTLVLWLQFYPLHVNKQRVENIRTDYYIIIGYYQ